jgi:hypothetical protein
MLERTTSLEGRFNELERHLAALNGAKVRGDLASWASPPRKVIPDCPQAADRQNISAECRVLRS